MTSGILRNLRLDARAIGEAHGEGIAETASARNLEADVAIGTPLLAVNDGSLANSTRNLRKSWIVRADDGSAIVRQQREKISESVIYRLEAAVMVEMVGLDVCHERDVRGKMHEGTIRLVGLDDVILARAALGIGVVAIDRAADDEARIEPHAIDGRRKHRGSSRLAVRASAGKRLLALPERGKRLRAMPYGDTALGAPWRARDFFREWHSR